MKISAPQIIMNKFIIQFYLTPFFNPKTGQTPAKAPPAAPPGFPDSALLPVALGESGIWYLKKYIKFTLVKK
jgi:hypothetical protein